MCYQGNMPASGDGGVLCVVWRFTHQPTTSSSYHGWPLGQTTCATTRCKRERKWRGEEREREKENMWKKYGITEEVSERQN